MMLWLMLIITVVMVAVTIGIFHAMPPFWRNLVAVHPVISFLFNWGVSIIIVIFTSAGMMAGVSNLAASLIFAIYALWYKKQHGIKMVQKQWQPFGFWPLKRIVVGYPSVISER